MRKLLIGLLLLPSMALAQGIVKKDVYCDKMDVIMTALIKEYEEKPVWIGKDGETKSNFTLLVNPKTNAWTLVQFDKDVACVLGTGSDSSILQTTSKFTAAVK
jgi:hypothetical protein